MEFRSGKPGPPPTQASATHDVKITETHLQTNIRWDPSYLKSIPGMLKLAAVIVDLVGFICVMCASAYWRTRSVGSWFAFVTMTGFWTTGTLLVFYLLHVIEKFHVIPWMLIEMVFCTVWAFFFLTGALDTAINAANDSAFGAAAFFAFVAMGIYGFDAFLKFRGWRAGQHAQGLQTVQVSKPDVPAPAY